MPSPKKGATVLGEMLLLGWARPHRTSVETLWCQTAIHTQQRQTSSAELRRLRQARDQEPPRLLGGEELYKERDTCYGLGPRSTAVRGWSTVAAWEVAEAPEGGLGGGLCAAKGCPHGCSGDQSLLPGFHLFT